MSKQLTVEERFQRNIQKLEERKQNNIKRYQKTELKKYIPWCCQRVFSRALNKEQRLHGEPRERINITL